MSTRSRSKSGPASNRSSNPNGNRGPGRTPPTPASGIEFAGDPTDLPPGMLEQLQAMGPQFSLPEGAVLTGARIHRLDDPQQQEAEPGEGPVFDPENLFGLQLEDPLPDGATLAGGSDSAAPTSPAGSTGPSLSSAAAANPLATKAKAKAFAKLAGAAFAALTALLNLRLRVDEDDATWIADEEDLNTIGTPAGRLLARHAPLPGGEDASDLADGIDLGIGVAGYLIKNSMAAAATRRERRRAAVPTFEG